jgi:hypothetical protein
MSAWPNLVATALSRRTANTSAAGGFGCGVRALLGLARRSLVRLSNRMIAPLSPLCVVAGAIAAPGCLVTETPTFTDPAQTRPFLLAETAEPDLREMVVITPEQNSAFPFRASFVSEDAAQDVEARLLLDYGVLNEFIDENGDKLLVPYVDSENAGGQASAARLSDGPRPMKMRLQLNGVTAGCHTVTMIVSHSFQGDIPGCPQDLEDSSQLTWQVFRCADPAAACPPTADGFDPTLDCPIATVSCQDTVVADGGTP